MILTVGYQAKAGTKSLTEKTWMIIKITIGFLLFFVFQLSAKTPPPPAEIHGKVVNQKGEPIQNASVLVAGTSIGTTTGSDGTFTLSVPGNVKNASLQISSVGFQMKTVRVGKPNGN